ncbi:MAG: MraY family glycosyltransferase [Pirellulaceae bacterium]|nr:MraY family glycosyltransferase [Pirellulaceae bacterium]
MSQPWIWAIFGVLAGAFALSAGLTWWMIGFSARLGLVDRPTERKNHGRVVPKGGGVAMIMATLLFFAGLSVGLWWLTGTPERAEFLPEALRVHLPGGLSKLDSLWWILGLAGAIGCLGFCDDRWGVPWPVRLGLQFLLATLCVYGQGWQMTVFIGVPAVGVVLSVIWIVALINSFNMLDNMDGLSAGVATIVCLTLAVFLLNTMDVQKGSPQYFVAGLLFVLAGTLGGFLVFNRAPARIFMGDSGSFFIGFLIAVCTLLATYTHYDSDNKFRILAAPMVLAVPFYDMVSVIWIRLREGRSPFQADRCHLSHRLENMGMTRPEAVLTIYVLTGICGLSTVTLSFVDARGAGLLIAVVLLVLLLVAMLEKTGKRPKSAVPSSAKSGSVESRPVGADLE